MSEHNSPILGDPSELRQCVSTDAAACGSMVPKGTTRSPEKTCAAQDDGSLAWGNAERLQPHPPAGSLLGSTLPTEPERGSFVHCLDGSLSASVKLPGAGGSVPTAPAGGRLGKYAPSSTPPTREARDVDRKKIQATRAERYQLLAMSRALLLQEGKKAGLLYPGNYHSTAKCRHVTRSRFVGVHTSRDHAGAFYSGLVTCGSVWACPVCAAKIQERRREEIAQGMEWAYAKGLQPVMVTLTFPHYAWQELSVLLAQQAFALEKLRAGNPWTRFKDRHGFEGLIRGLELTYGTNGWHPHTHEMWFVSGDVDAQKMKVHILARWERVCARAGLLDLTDEKQLAAFREHAVDVKGWCSTSDYLAKFDEARHWGADRELAKSSTKEGRAKGLHPFALLANAAEGDKAAGALFVQYVDAMRRKAQLYWAPRLKAKVGLVEKSDEDLAEESREAADALGYLELDDWRTVREARAQAQLLDAAEAGGWPAVESLLERLTLAEIARLEAMLSSP